MLISMWITCGYVPLGVHSVDGGVHSVDGGVHSVDTELVTLT